MKRIGPCRHCGINSTPMWRQGPVDKVVLCNACGTRFKNRGHLNNYLPKHCKPNYNYLSKLPYRNLKVRGKPLTNLANSYKGGRKSARIWKKSRIPSRKRSPRVYKRMTPIQKFQKQLLDEWVKLQGEPNDSSSEEVLLFNNVNNFIPTNEIGVGVILINPDGTSK